MFPVSEEDETVIEGPRPGVCPGSVFLSPPLCVCMGGESYSSILDREAATSDRDAGSRKLCGLTYVRLRK